MHQPATLEKRYTSKHSAEPDSKKDGTVDFDGHKLTYGHGTVDFDVPPFWACQFFSSLHFCRKNGWKVTRHSGFGSETTFPTVQYATALPLSELFAANLKQVVDGDAKIERSGLPSAKFYC
ncbi:hypothetical protein M8C21_023960 [Ambrosia artemisiifolia]|uniref:Uncharacterized protein n=1 Tax=Ambrosia artemisiifolia TaxID=4212 RepID=A0AAD5GHQ8_AMBAR|nr:hypothetical protein M8C21_023960 [Ambrosia artemisiifolia]